MKSEINFYLIFVFVILFTHKSNSQDSLNTNNNNILIGIKILPERSSNYGFVPGSVNVLSGGFQVVKKINQSKWAFETGIYFLTRGFEFFPPVYFYYINAPLNIRLENKVVYFALGFDMDYFLLKDITYIYKLSDSGNYRTLNIGFNLNIGIQKEITKKCNLFVEGRYNNNLTTFMYNDRSGCFVNYGFGIGVNYKIKNNHI